MQELKMFTPAKIGSCTIPNRIIMSPASTKFSTPDGFVSQSTIDYYAERAKGGIGLILIQAVEVDFPAGNTYTPPILVTDDKYIPGLKQLTDAVHKYGAKIAAQIHHGGPSAPREITGMQPVSSSNYNRPEMFGYVATEMPRALTVEEIKDHVEMHAQAARICKEAGFDIVEIHAAHRYLVNSFISKAWNKRTDDYNGDLKHRARILMEIVARTRELVGDDYPLMCRINGHEYIEQFGLNGVTIDDAKELAVMLEEAGINALDISAFPANNPRMEWGSRTPLAEAIKKVVNIPVVAVGGIDAEIGERILQENRADFIALGRGVFADPDLANKVKEGRLEDIRPCLSCNTCNVKLYDWWNCAINPCYGKERAMALKPAETKKNVVIIGAGPAGMQCASDAALRGHNVTLFDKQDEMGGMMRVSAAIEDRNYNLLKYLSRQVVKNGVTVKLGQEVTPTLIQELHPDVVIVATGSTPKTLDIPGMEKQHVMNAYDLFGEDSFLKTLTPKVKAGANIGVTDERALVKKYALPFASGVAVLGGELGGLEVAAFCMKQGIPVTVLDPGEFVMDIVSDPMPRLRKHIRQQLQLADSVMTNVTFDEVTDKGIAITTKEGEKKVIEANTIILALGMESNAGLAQSLEGLAPEVYNIGDSEAAHGIMYALQAGARVARAI